MITLPLSTKRMPSFYNFFWKLLNSPQMKAILCTFTEKFQRRIQNNPYSEVYSVQKQPFTGVFRKRCSENLQQIYRRTPMPNCDFNKVIKLYCGRTLAWVLSCKFAAYFPKTFL